MICLQDFGFGVFMNIFESCFEYRSVLENFLLDSNIFGLDASRDPHNAKDKSMIMLYQPHIRLTGIKNDPLDDTEKFILSKYQEFNLQVRSTLQPK